MLFLAEKLDEALELHTARWNPQGEAQAEDFRGRF